MGINHTIADYIHVCKASQRQFDISGAFASSKKGGWVNYLHQADRDASGSFACLVEFYLIFIH